jgi:hypothetical protein
MLYPWRYGMTVCEELTVIGFVAEPAHRELQARRDQIA